MKFNISDYSWIVLSLFALFSVLISYYFYRKSSLNQFKKYLLLTIKSIAIFLLCILFIEPSFLFHKRNNSTTANILLVDNSRSNELTLNDKTKKSVQVKNLLGNFKNIGNIKSYTFSSGEANTFSFSPI